MININGQIICDLICEIYGKDKSYNDVIYDLMRSSSEVRDNLTQNVYFRTKLNKPFSFAINNYIDDIHLLRLLFVIDGCPLSYRYWKRFKDDLMNHNSLKGTIELMFLRCYQLDILDDLLLLYREFASLNNNIDDEIEYEVIDIEEENKLEQLKLIEFDRKVFAASSNQIKYWRMFDFIQCWPYNTLLRTFIGMISYTRTCNCRNEEWFYGFKLIVNKEIVNLMLKILNISYQKYVMNIVEIHKFRYGGFNVECLFTMINKIPKKDRVEEIEWYVNIFR